MTREELQAAEAKINRGKEILSSEPSDEEYRQLAIAMMPSREDVAAAAYDPSGMYAAELAPDESLPSEADLELIATPAYRDESHAPLT